MAGTGSPRSSSPSGSNLEVHRMHMNVSAMSRQSAMMMKLTDESIAAIKVAQNLRQPVRLKIDKQGGVVEIGNSEQATRFRFVVQEIPGAPADAIIFDCHNRYRTVAILHNKIQVQTTAKALAETREKLIEEEKKKKMKETSRHKREQRPVTVKRATNPLAINAQRPSPSSSARSHQPDFLNKNATLKNTGNQQQQNSTSAAGARSFVRAELSRRPLRKRVIHLVVLGRFRSADEIITQLRKDSLNEEIAHEDVERVQEMVDEVAEFSRELGRLQLKQAFHNEVDARWPGFSSEEKGYVRKILSGYMGNVTNFAPIRKTRIGPMVAPATGVTAHNNVPTDDSTNRITESKSPESTVSSISSKSPVEVINNVNCTETNSKVTDDLSGTSALSTKRKAHVQQLGTALSQAASKRPRQHSLSPPEDPLNAGLAVHPQHVKSSGQRVFGVNDTEPLSSSSTGFLLCKPQPSRDWSKEFPEPRSLEEAEKYYHKFLEDYPKYLTCYNRLAAVVNEFKELERIMNEAPKNSKEHEKAEEAIEARYMDYQRNQDYLETRQKHEDLRSKLEVLKRRVDFWENNPTKFLQSNKNGLNNDKNNNNGNSSRHHVLKNADCASNVSS